MNFINYTVITRSNFMKRILPFHLCHIWIWQIATKIINSLFNAYQIPFGQAFHTFKHGWSKFYLILHTLQSQSFPYFLSRNVVTGGSKGLFGVLNINMVFNLPEQFEFIHRYQSGNFLPTASQNDWLLAICNLVHKVSKMFSSICGRNSGGHRLSPLYYAYIMYIRYFSRSTLIWKQEKPFRNTAPLDRKR